MPSRVTSLRSRLRRSASDDRGLTLVELLVAILILGLLGTMVVNIYVQTTRAVTHSSNLSQNTKVASNIINEMTRVIRTANTNATGSGVYESALVDARANSLTLIAYVDSDAVNPRPIRVRFSINTTTNQIVETRWSAIAGPTGLWIFNSSNPVISTRTLPGTIIAGEPLFRYYLQNRTTEVTPPAAGLSEVNRKKIAAIKVSILVQGADNANAEPLALSNLVGLPNLGLYTEVTP